MKGLNISSDFLSVSVRPNSAKTKVVVFNELDNHAVIELRAPAHDNKANKELVKYLTKLTGRTAKIKSGLTSKKKLVVFDA